MLPASDHPIYKPHKFYLPIDAWFYCKENMTYYNFIETDGYNIKYHTIAVYSASYEMKYIGIKFSRDVLYNQLEEISQIFMIDHLNFILTKSLLADK